jgi:uncharacterized membrane protein YagU involved in acid resistance
MQKWPRENCPKRFLGSRAIRRNIHLSTAELGDTGMSKSSASSVDGLPDSAGTGDYHHSSTEVRIVKDFVAPILLGGIIAGTLDIGAASLINSAKPTVILQAIAGGLLGKSAFSGGAATIELGLVLQWSMSIVIAAIFVVAAQWRPVLKRHWIKVGLLYGIAVFIVMNYVVLPLSAVGHAPRFRIVHFTEDILAMLLFGLIIAFFARQRANR